MGGEEGRSTELKGENVILNHALLYSHSHVPLPVTPLLSLLSAAQNHHNSVISAKHFMAGTSGSRA